MDKSGFKMDKNWGGMEAKKAKKIYSTKNTGKDAVCSRPVIIAYFPLHFYRRSLS